MKTSKIFALTLILLFSTFQLKAQGSGNMLELNGSTTFATAGTINLSGSALSICAWINVNSFKPNAPFISSIAGTEVGVQQLALLRLGDGGLAANKLQFVIGINSFGQKLDGNTSLNTNQWYHVAATYDGAFMRIYINGILDVQRPQTGALVSNGLFEIGRNYDNGRILNGKIDEVSVWKTALSQQAIRDLMCKSITNAHPAWTNLAGYWKFDENAGTTSVDHSSNSNTATYIGTPLRSASGAPIGNQSVYEYGSNLDVGLGFGLNDSIYVSNLSANADAIHVYRVDAVPNNSNGLSASGVSEIDSAKYWGVFIPNSSTVLTCDFDYYYSGNPALANSSPCGIDLYSRSGNNGVSWTAGNASQTSTALSISGSQVGEFLLGFKSGISIYPVNSANVCQGDSVQFGIPLTGGNYTWLYNNNILTGFNQRQLKVATAGTYQLIYTTTSCTDTSNLVTLNVNPSPTVSLSQFPSLCKDGSIFPLSGGTPSGGSYSGPFVGSNSFNSISAPAGTYTVTYQYVSSAGCAGTATSDIVVNNLPSVSIAPLTGLCSNGLAIVLSNGSPAGGVYSIQQQSMTSLDPSSIGAGTNYLKYTFTDMNNCSNADSVSITINNPPDVELEIDMEFCENDEPWAITGQSPSGGTFSGNGVSMFNFSPSDAGVGTHTITYTYTSFLTSCSNEASADVLVNAIPQTPSISVDNDTLKVNSLGAANYYWYNQQGALVSSGNNYFYPTSLTGNYFVIIENDVECKSNASEVFNYQRAPAGINSLNRFEIEIYPNPVNAEGSIFFSELATYFLYDSFGRLVLQSDIPTNQISLSNISNGLYFIRLNESDEMRKIIVK